MRLHYDSLWIFYNLGPVSYILGLFRFVYLWQFSFITVAVVGVVHDTQCNQSLNIDTYLLILETGLGCLQFASYIISSSFFCL